jgi:hypothetical protein
MAQGSKGFKRWGSRSYWFPLSNCNLQPFVTAVDSRLANSANFNFGKFAVENASANRFRSLHSKALNDLHQCCSNFWDCLIVIYLLQEIKNCYSPKIKQINHQFS